ncbi:serine/threonine protein kinase with TPR repeats [Candidatus Moduliflexus flocculans]|uniref:Serine/threonine protein kinase with TPR repeats n=1 Tax=Candidatus Moduliflexus flocculans TaxID=1499966 RepID=A0A0S6W1F0_9BACT|nr:serine/threonine protein kinase with TPR repeats [Candidatus Moduliflexus flocculans]
MNIRDFIHTKTRGRYEQIIEMAQEEGGFGRLYKALDTERQNREVCIKVIKPHLSKELQIKLWHEEVQALELYHNRSGIVHLVDKQYEFTDDDPYWFLVMEYVHGKRLGASKYRIDVDVEEEQAIRLIFQLCSVIYSIHQRGKYHQDIFPDNIKIQGEDVILLDLGGMREAERRSGTIIFGGEMYSPPEVSPTRLRMKRFRALRKQKMGSFESADIFSIGALCYELIMGESFFQNIEQSNQLKEYIYDYYVDPETLKRMKREYQEALNVAQRRAQQFSQYLERLEVSPQLQDCLTRALAIHPQKRPNIEEMLESFLPFMVQRAKTAHHNRQWAHVLLWIRHVEQHFDEIRIESTDADVAFKQKMQQHLIKHAAMYVEACLVRGMAQFHQELFEAAQRNFLKTHEVLDLYQDGYSVTQRNAYLLKVTNNVAACLYKRSQKHEALHLFKTLSTAQGKFGQTIMHNIQICAA